MNEEVRMPVGALVFLWILMVCVFVAAQYFDDIGQLTTFIGATLLWSAIIKDAKERTAHQAKPEEEA